MGKEGEWEEEEDDVRSGEEVEYFGKVGDGRDYCKHMQFSR